MNTTISSSGRYHQLAASAGILGPIIFASLIVLGGLLRENYSHLSQAISELGETGSSVQALQITNFFILGITIAFFVISFHRRFPGSTRLTTGLLLYFAVFTGIGNGVFPCDPGCEGITTIGLLHNLTGLTGFVLLSVAMFLISKQMRKYEDWDQWTVYTKITGYLIIGFLVIWIITGPGGNVLPEVHGLFQRLMVLSLLQWFIVMGFNLLSRPNDTQRLKRQDQGQAIT